MQGNNSCQSCGGALSPSDRFCPTCGSEQGAEGGGAAETVVSQGSLDRIITDRLTEATTGEFDILERIGYGSMGSVYLARDVALSRRVAIKVFSPQLLQDESMVARFRLEAQTVAALRHPNIVNIYAVREIGDLHFFIMDYIDGPSLRSLIKAHGQLDIGVTQALLFQIGSALSYAHRRGQGVIHRDVKPANVMVDREGNAVVMDFGISKVGASQSGLTQTGATIGTPEYMSPEQCMDKELTGASDQYALGIVAYEMITGAVPFKGSTYAIMMAHAEGTPRSIRRQRAECPPKVEETVMRMLAKSADERFPDLAEAMAAMGGAPLGHGDPVRGAIIALVDSVSSEAAGLDTSSPLSPVPASRVPARAPDADTIPLTVVSPPAAAAVATSPHDAAGAPEKPEGHRRFWIVIAAVIVIGLGLPQLFPAGGTPEVTQGASDVVTSGDTPPAEGGAEDAEPNPGVEDAEPGPGTDSPGSAGDAPPPEVVAPPRGPVVTSVRITVGARALRVGGRTPISAAALTDGGATVDDVPVEWSSSASDVATIRGGQLVAGGAGTTMITATVAGVVGRVGVRVMAPPSRQEVAALLQKSFVDLLGRRDTGAIERLLGRGGGAARQREILQRMREPSFSAQITRMGDVTPSGAGVTMNFDLGLSWRDQRGARVPTTTTSFRAMLAPSPTGWRLAGVNRLRR